MLGKIEPLTHILYMSEDFLVQIPYQ